MCRTNGGLNKLYYKNPAVVQSIDFSVLNCTCEVHKLDLRKLYFLFQSVSL